MFRAMFLPIIRRMTVFTASGGIHPISCRLVSWMSWNGSFNSSMTPADSYLGEYY
jgi:hypothetical protein